MYIFLDESGDLGFDFDKHGTSKFFVITLLVIISEMDKRKIEKSVERTIRTKIKKGRKTKNGKKYLELKGTNTIFEIKKYFWNQIKTSSFEIYTLILNKKNLHDYLMEDKERLYNYISRLILEKVAFQEEQSKIYIVIDKRKKSEERQEFNRYILLQLKGLINPKIALEIFHQNSQTNSGLQVVDLFSWGIFRKYEWSDSEWFNVIKDRIVYEEVYLP